MVTKVSRPKMPRNKYGSTEPTSFTAGGSSTSIMQNNSYYLNWDEMTDEQKQGIVAVLGSDLEKYMLPVNTEGWYFGDSSGNVVAKIDDGGFDCTSIGANLRQIILDVVRNG